MLDFLLTPAAQAVIMTFLLAVMLIIGVAAVLRFRNFTDEDKPTTSKLLTNFQELHDRGDISQEEYRKLKTVLHEKLQHELLNDDGETG